MNLFEMQAMETEKEEFDGEAGHNGGGGGPVGSYASLLLCDSAVSALLCL
ncbi:SapB/AmfS family lanthipeptide [Streptomyces odontomachi]|nr:SapB/AmfS family lanthipeptide [Streptomyces sp. ODS25]